MDRDDQREASASGGEDRASSAFSDSLASASVIKDNLNRQGQHRPAVDSQTSDPQVALSSQTANNVNPSSTNGIGAGWSEIGSTGRSGTVKSSIIPSNGLLITAIGSPTSMATTASTSVEAPWQARRRSLSPTEIGTTLENVHENHQQRKQLEHKSEKQLDTIFLQQPNSAASPGAEGNHCVRLEV